eukprot:Hpha_TRINITY_DN15770_c6_g7::TRINITY_DN15770_c6_g7_i1::g.41374::m.41374
MPHQPRLALLRPQHLPRLLRLLRRRSRPRNGRGGASADLVLRESVRLRKLPSLPGGDRLTHGVFSGCKTPAGAQPLARLGNSLLFPQLGFLLLIALGCLPLDHLLDTKFLGLLPFLLPPCDALPTCLPLGGFNQGLLPHLLVCPQSLAPLLQCIQVGRLTQPTGRGGRGFSERRFAQCARGRPSTGGVGSGCVESAGPLRGRLRRAKLRSLAGGGGGQRFHQAPQSLPLTDRGDGELVFDVSLGEPKQGLSINFVRLTSFDCYLAASVFREIRHNVFDRPRGRGRHPVLCCPFLQDQEPEIKKVQK